MFKVLTETVEKYKKQGFSFVPVKVDYLAERSIPDNIELEAT